jgi:hypothetical protein
MRINLNTINNNSNAKYSATQNLGYSQRVNFQSNSLQKVAKEYIPSVLIEGAKAAPAAISFISSGHDFPSFVESVGVYLVSKGFLDGVEIGLGSIIKKGETGCGKVWSKFNVVTFIKSRLPRACDEATTCSCLGK